MVGKKIAQTKICLTEVELPQTSDKEEHRTKKTHQTSPVKTGTNPTRTPKDQKFWPDGRRAGNIGGTEAKATGKIGKILRKNLRPNEASIYASNSF